MGFAEFTLLFLLGGATTTLAAFVSTPTSVNAILGSTATFSCSATTGTIDWRLNGSLLTELETPDIRATGSGSTFSLHVPATEEYNNTVVVCELITRNPLSIESSAPAFLKVQGSLDAVIVRNISLVDVICLKWVDPPSLDITGVDLDFWYHVDVTVVDVTMVDVTMVDVSLSTYHFMKVVNIPEFNFTVADGIDTNISVIYQFEVTPINGAGDGVTSSPVTGFFRRTPRSITHDMVITNGSADPLNVNFTITFGYVPPGEMPDRFRICAETVGDEDKLYYCTDDISMTPDSDGRVFIHLNTTHDNSGLKPHRRYKAVITGKNQAGESNSTGDIHFSTHEVQFCEANNSSQSGTVNISCTFSNSSKAMGYLSVLSSETNRSRKMFVVACRDDMYSSDLKISVSGVRPDKYSVIVYDIEINGLPVLSNETSSFVLCAEEKDVAVITEPQATTSDNVVDGIFLEVTNTQVPVCVSFECINGNSEMVVLAHHIGDDDGDGDDDSEKLSAYYLNSTNNCFTALTTGSYVVGVFTRMEDNTLVPPTNGFIISQRFSASPTPVFCAPGLPVSPGAYSIPIIIVFAIVFPVSIATISIVSIMLMKKYSRRKTHFIRTAKPKEGDGSYRPGSQDLLQTINPEPEDCQLPSPPGEASSFVAPVEESLCGGGDVQVTRECATKTTKNKGVHGI